MSDVGFRQCLLLDARLSQPHIVSPSQILIPYSPVPRKRKTHEGYTTVGSHKQGISILLVISYLDLIGIVTKEKLLLAVFVCSFSSFPLSKSSGAAMYINMFSVKKQEGHTTLIAEAVFFYSITIFKKVLSPIFYYIGFFSLD